ncbi:GDSL esterase/lipase At5g03600-like [Panicum virgatum]|nr:GDSL esterase/lipase At5g03600-like [Panicum virgatum]
MALAEDVTDMIADGVKRLQELGVSKVLVNLMPPMGCQPYRTWMSNYAQCDSHVNAVSNIHNTALKRKMDGFQDVLLLDLDSIFSQLTQSNSEFKGKYTPCCDASSKPEGYCGQEDSNGNAQYTLCPNPEDFFYWDYVHPTQAAWEAVMNRLEQPILNFLGF